MLQFKTIHTYKLDMLDYFIIIFKHLKLIKNVTSENTSFVFIVHQNSCILVANDNTLKDEGVFYSFFLSSKIHYHLRLMSIATKN